MCIYPIKLMFKGGSSMARFVWVVVARKRHDSKWEQLYFEFGINQFVKWEIADVYAESVAEQYFDVEVRKTIAF